MRNNHQGYPELLSTYERDQFHFAVVRVDFPDEITAYEFGVERSGYHALTKILQTQPFDRLGEHRYFFTGRFGRKKLNSEPVTFGVRIEQNGVSKNFDFDGPTSLVSNLRWFLSLKSPHEASALVKIATTNLMK
jgi:hypothetical protein